MGLSYFGGCTVEGVRASGRRSERLQVRTMLDDETAASRPCVAARDVSVARPVEAAAAVLLSAGLLAGQQGSVQ
eukprot:5972864-Pleurochrysis_carterae.AAC.2